MEKKLRCKKKFKSKPIIADSKGKGVGEIIIRSCLPQDYTAKVESHKGGPQGKYPF